MTIAVENTWRELAAAELATAEGPASAESLRRAAKGYEQNGFPEVALTCLRKADTFGINGRAVLPDLLGILRRQRRFPELHAALQGGLAIADREPDLRHELALALSSLGQAPAAEMEWATLIRSGGMTQSHWLDCARFVMNCADGSALVQMMAAIEERAELKGQCLVGYCVARHLIDRDVAATRALLSQIAPPRLSDPEILLDLAILCWRVGEYQKAESAATLAAGFAGAPPACAMVRGSIRSFGGDFSHLRKAPLPRARSADEIILKFAAGAAPETTAWGCLHREASGALGTRVFDLTADAEMVVPEEFETVVSFSVLSAGSSPDPFQILAGVDWQWPHLMLQRRPSGPVLHYFVGSHRAKEWPWEEVTPDAGVHENGPLCAGRRQQSPVWLQALRELSEPDEDKQ